MSTSPSLLSLPGPSVVLATADQMCDPHVCATEETEERDLMLLKERKYFEMGEVVPEAMPDPRALLMEERNLMLLRAKK